MPFCASCGAPVEGRFCAKCGSPVVAGGPGPAGPVPQPMGQPGTYGAIADNVASALCYVLGLITGIIFLVFALACFLLWLYLIFSAYQGKTVVLPIVGPLAQKQA